MPASSRLYISHHQIKPTGSKMTKITHLLLLASALMHPIFCSPALYQDGIGKGLTKRQPQRARTITVTETETETEIETETITSTKTVSKIQTLTSCNTGTTTLATTTQSSQTTSTTASAAEPTNDGNGWVVSGLGTFQNKRVYTFENGMPDGLESANYVVEGTAAGAPYDHQFVPQNVFVDDGILNLRVSAVPQKQQKKGLVVKSGEVSTIEKNLKYGSVRTVASFSKVKGSCHGV